MIYLNKDDYIKLNKMAVVNENESYLGIEGLDILKEVEAYYFGRELYPSIWLKAAFILQKITKKHIFETYLH